MTAGQRTDDENVQPAYARGFGEAGAPLSRRSESGGATFNIESSRGEKLAVKGQRAGAHCRLGPFCLLRARRDFLSRVRVLFRWPQRHLLIFFAESAHLKTR